MVRVSLLYKDGRKKMVNFPKATLRDVKKSAPRINPKIKSVKLAPRRKSRNEKGFVEALWGM